jgi:hypothetical protein
MTHKEIEEYRQKLTQIKIDLKGEENREERITNLLDLAMEVGASTGRQRSADGRVDPVGLVNNIHIALQTASMIDMCKTACRNFWIALIAMLVALGSAVAAWVVVYK